jgi:hypothetical protein
MTQTSSPTKNWHDWQQAKSEKPEAAEAEENAAVAKHTKPTVTPESLVIIKRGQKAFKDLDKDKNWHSWLQVGEAIMECRLTAMRHAGVNAPFGRGYTAAYAYLMEHYKFAEQIKDKGDRQKLVAIMENLPAVEAWRAGLSPEDKRRWNHPTTVFRQWDKAKKEASALSRDNDDLWRKPSAREQVKALKSEVHELKKGGHLPWGPGDGPHDQARAIREHLSAAEAEALALAILAMLKKQRDADERNNREEDDA